MNLKKRLLNIADLKAVHTKNKVASLESEQHSDYSRTSKSFSSQWFDQSGDKFTVAKSNALPIWYTSLSDGLALECKDPFGEQIPQSNHSFSVDTDYVPSRIDDPDYITITESASLHSNHSFDEVPSRVDNPDEISVEQAVEVQALSDDEIDAQLNKFLKSMAESEDSPIIEPADYVDPFTEKLQREAARQNKIEQSTGKVVLPQDAPAHSLSESVFERLGHSLSMATNFDLGTKSLVRQRIDEFASSLASATSLETPNDKLDDEEIMTSLSVITKNSDSKLTSEAKPAVNNSNESSLQDSDELDTNMLIEISKKLKQVTVVDEPVELAISDPKQSTEGKNISNNGVNGEVTHA